MKKLFIAEFTEELLGFLKYSRSHGLKPQEFLTLALQAEVQVLCKQEGLDYIDTLPFFKTPSHIRVLKQSHRLTSLIMEKLSFPVDEEVNKVLMDTFIFYSRFYLNNYLWIIEVLEGIRKEYSEKVEIYVYKRLLSLGAPHARTNPYLTKRDRYLHLLVEKYCHSKGMSYTLLENSGDNKNLKVNPTAGPIKRILKYAALRLFRLKIKGLARNPVVFAAAPSYNLDRVCREIQGVYPQVTAVTDYHLPAGMSMRGYVKLCLMEIRDLLTRRKSENQMLAVPVGLFAPASSRIRAIHLNQVHDAFEKFASENKREFTYAGCSFWEEFQLKVKTHLLEALADLLTGSIGRRTFLESIRPKLVMSPVSTAEYQDWAQVSAALNIPALVIPQKTLLKPGNPDAQIEESYIGRAQVTDTFAYAAAQSPLVTGYLKWSEYKGEILETGNLIFARLNTEKRAERREKFFKEIGGVKKVIVWAPSMKTRKSRRFYVLESIDELLSAMQDVFSAVSRLEDVHLVFRIHPGDAITKAEIYSLLQVPANASVSDSGSYEEVLALADLLISYSSTAVQEALINYIPVLLYDKWNRYNHLKAEAVENPVPAKIAAVYYFHQKENLESAIKWILEQHTQKEVSKELFKNYAFINKEQHMQYFFDFVGKCLNEGIEGIENKE